MKKIKTSNVVLVVIAVILIAFTVANLIIFTRIGAVPDVLVTAVFSSALSEFGFLAWIRNTKQKYRDDAPFEEEEE